MCEKRRDRENKCTCGKRYYGSLTACHECLAKRQRDRLSIAKGKELYASKVERLRLAVKKHNEERI